MPSSDWYTKYAAIAPEFNALDVKYQMVSSGGAAFDPARNAWVVGAVTTTDPLTGATTIQPGSGTVVMTKDEFDRYNTLLPQYNELITEYQTDQAGTSLSDQIAALNFQHDSDPRSIDAKNSADAFARQMDVQDQASSLAQHEYDQQPTEQKAASDSFQNFLGSSMPGSFGVASFNLPNQTDLFNSAVKTVQAGLPKVTPEPYYGNRTLTPPNSGPKLSDYDAGLRIGGYASGGARVASQSPFGGTDPFANGPAAAGQKGGTFNTAASTGSIQGPSTAQQSPAYKPGPSIAATVGAPAAPGVAQLTGPNPANSPFLPGYKPPAIAGSVLNKPNPLIARLPAGVFG